MNILRTATLSLGAAFALTGIAQSALAQGYNVDVNVPGVSVHAGDNSTNVSVEGVGTVTDTGVDIHTGGVNVTTGVTSKGGNASGNTNVMVHAPGVIIKSTTGNTVTLGSNGQTLHTVVSSGIDSGSAKTIVSLSGDPSLYIKDQSDVDAYNTLLVSTSPSIVSASTNSQKVEVAYVQQAKLFGFIPMHLNARVSVDANGNVSVMLPWYSFLATKDTASLKASVAQQFTSAKAGNQIVVSNGAFSSTDQVRVSHSVAEVLSNDASVVVRDGYVSVQTGDTSVKVNGAY
ncbi:MAG: hypothetical protein JWL75_678 [Parcubacteria group bacterium]|nr:hypothetical protein [Parcubacteria group bacterium]